MVAIPASYAEKNRCPSISTLLLCLLSIAYCEQGREVKAETYDSYVKEGFELPEYWNRPGGLELRFVTAVVIKQVKIKVEKHEGSLNS